MNEEEKIVDVIKNAPAYLKLSDDCKNFFNKEGKEYNLKKIMNLFFFFEHLCFEDLAETLQPEYKAPIPEDIKVKIINVFMKQKKEIKKRTLGKCPFYLTNNTKIYMNIYSTIKKANKGKAFNIDAKSNKLLNSKNVITCKDTGTNLYPNQIGTYELYGNTKMEIYYYHRMYLT